VTAGSRSIAAASSRTARKGARPPGAGRRRPRGRSRRRRDHAGPRQRGNASRAVVSAGRGAAGLRVREVDSRRHGGAAGTADPNAAEIVDSIDRALEESVESGTAIVGDISNTLVTFAPLTRSRLAAVVFYELIRFNAPDPEASSTRRGARSTRSSDEPRARQPRGATRRTRRAARLSRDAESESTAIRSPRAACTLSSRGGGRVHSQRRWAVASAARRGRRWDPRWVAPGVSPVQFLGRQRLSRTTACSPCTASRWRRGSRAARGPRHVARQPVREATAHRCRRPPIAEFYESGVRVAIGTGSLASSPDLNVFADSRRCAHWRRACRRSSCWRARRSRGRALGFDADYGTIDPGKLARLLIIDVPPDVDDVENISSPGSTPTRYGG